jgi:hypothetical protein
VPPVVHATPVALAMRPLQFVHEGPHAVAACLTHEFPWQHPFPHELAVHTHAPLHAWPAEHAFVHVPQWPVSFERLAQIPLQYVWPPVGHTQLPLLHDALLWHALPHTEQLFESLFTLVQMPFTPPHSSGVLPLHRHAPPPHVWPPMHAVRFAQLVPQWLESFAMS